MRDFLTDILVDSEGQGRKKEGGNPQVHFPSGSQIKERKKKENWISFHSFSRRREEGGEKERGEDLDSQGGCLLDSLKEKKCI